MGELIMMPSRKPEPAEQEQTPIDTKDAALSAEFSDVDFSVWKKAPKERTVAYFPTYSMVSRAMQGAMRAWVREWFAANPEILLRPHTAYPILVYQCTHPFSGKPTNIFTYDIQQTEALDRAFASAAHRLGRELKALDTKRFSWFTREHYFAYRSKEVVKYVKKNRRAIYKMLNVETVLMDSILKFAIIDIPKLGLEDSLILLRRAFNTQLRRFSEEFDLGNRTEELLRIATDALASKLPTENVVAMPLAA
ncbi:MAG: hypothetical protein JO145_02445 [Acidobacteriaceae bacterium]|nr:hypothetical protein [Acidobacteriaceae bacterium]MBV9764879.1 hypothetical protein [Acidobacteriaceae bacterium]